MRAYRVIKIGSGSAYSRAIELGVTALRNRRLLPILGAGISYPQPSALPLGMDLKRALEQLLLDSISKARIAQADSEIGAEAAPVLNEAPLELLLESLWQVYGDQSMELLSFLDTRIWNNNHSALAALSKSDYLPSIITLNFDLLIEEAIVQTGGCASTVCPLSDYDILSGVGNPKTLIVKPHGSLSAPSELADRYRYIASTLSSVGERPHPKNEEAIACQLRRSPALLFAGYSDDDWDVFPIFEERIDQIELVLWIRHSENEKPKPKLEAWLRELNTRAYVLVGNVTQVLEDLCVGLKVFATRSPFLNRCRPAIDAEAIFPIADLNALALYSLLEGRISGRSFRILTDVLESQENVLNSPKNLSRLLKCKASLEHRERRFFSALRLNGQVYRLMQMAQAPASQIAEQETWIGYEWFSLVKWPKPQTVFLVPLFPILYLAGLFRMLHALRRVKSEERRDIRSLIRFYHFDLIHSWLTVSLIFGRHFTNCLAPIFRLLAAEYKKLEKTSPERFGWGYYWLRWLEASLLGRESVDYGRIRRRLEILRHSFGKTFNSPQQGNAHAYLALLEFCERNNLKLAQKELSDAKACWNTPARHHRSGILRVIVFSRYMGTMKFIDAVKHVWRTL